MQFQPNQIKPYFDDNSRLKELLAADKNIKSLHTSYLTQKFYNCKSLKVKRPIY